jgi:hypothetical protein
MHKCMAGRHLWTIDGAAWLPQVLGMARREFLRLVTSSAALGVLGSCVTASPKVQLMPVQTPKIRAICFDLFTLFDPRSVLSVAKTVVPEHAVELCDAWRIRQFESRGCAWSAGSTLTFGA